MKLTFVHLVFPMIICLSALQCTCFSVEFLRSSNVLKNTPPSNIIDHDETHNDDNSYQSKDISMHKIKKQSNCQKKPKPRIPILQYHNNWVCVDKPAGLTVHRSNKTPRFSSVLTTMLKRQLSRKVFPVHRLDHRTSGAMLFAFDSVTCGLLHSSLTSSCEEAKDLSRDDRSISISNSNTSQNILSLPHPAKKEYLALLRGDWKRKYNSDEVVIINKPLSVKGIIKEAKTEFRLLASFPGDVEEESDSNFTSLSACSLVLCSPKTGRTHQIRRHAYSIGYPVIGDTEHGDSKVNRWWKKNMGLNRMFLHCFSLDLPPISDEAKEDNDSVGNEIHCTNNNCDGTKDRIKCIAPLPSKLSDVLHREFMLPIWEESIDKDPRLKIKPYDITGGTFGPNYEKKILKEMNSISDVSSSATQCDDT